MICGGIKENLRKGDVSHDPGQDIVEIVGNASCEDTQGFQFFNFQLFFFVIFTFGYVCMSTNFSGLPLLSFKGKPMVLTQAGVSGKSGWNHGH